MNWRSSIKFGALLALAMCADWFWNGQRPSAMTFAIVLLLITASLVVEGATTIVSRLEEAKKELYTLRLVGDTLLSRTAQLVTDDSSAEAIEDRESLREE